MSYKIEKVGYEYRGYKLGQNVMYDKKEVEIIGFDEKEKVGGAFLAISTTSGNGITHNGYLTSVLDTAKNKGIKFRWLSESEIAPIKEKEKPMEKKMTKADLEGKWVKVVKGDNRNFKTGDVLFIKDKQIRSKNNMEGLYTWFNELPEEFTLKELNRVLATSYPSTSMEYFDKPSQPQNKVKSDSSKPNKRSDKTNLSVKVNVDMLFDKPVVEETKHEVYIFSGRTTVFIDKEMGIYGVATVNSNELNTYCKELGMSLAYRRAHLSLNKK